MYLLKEILRKEISCWNKLEIEFPMETLMTDRRSQKDIDTIPCIILDIWIRSIAKFSHLNLGCEVVVT